MMEDKIDQLRQERESEREGRSDLELKYQELVKVLDSERAEMAGRYQELEKVIEAKRAKNRILKQKLKAFADKLGH